MPRETVLFDINETVLDLSPLKPKFAVALGDPAAASTWFAMLLHASTVCALTGVRTGFAELAGLMLDRLAALKGRDLESSERSDILDSFASLTPHADVQPALENLRSHGYRTVAFSNSSQDLVTRQIANSGLAPFFNSVLSVEATGSFKPDGKVYAFAATRLERPIGDLRLVAAHDWDTHGALTAGMQAAYLDRSGASYTPLFRKPDIVETTMGDIAASVIAADRAANAAH
ncbi:MAG: haloacid dehalogenase type II [Pseudomonadota bacterium]